MLVLYTVLPNGSKISSYQAFHVSNIVPLQEGLPRLKLLLQTAAISGSRLTDGLGCSRLLSASFRKVTQLLRSCQRQMCPSRSESFFSRACCTYQSTQAATNLGNCLEYLNPCVLADSIYQGRCQLVRRSRRCLSQLRCSIRLTTSELLQSPVGRKPQLNSNYSSSTSSTWPIPTPKGRSILVLLAQSPFTWHDQRTS